MSEVKHDVMPGDTVCPTCDSDFDTHQGMKYHHSIKHDVSITGYWIDCHWCGETHHKRQLKDRNDHEFCSKECYSEYQSSELSGENSHAWEGGKLVTECDYCGSDTEKHPVYVEKSEQSFCDRECSRKWKSENISAEDSPSWKGAELEVECHTCGKSHRKSTSKIERNVRNFCSQSCRGEWQSEYRTGKNHPRWIEGNNTISYGGTWPRKRRERLEKDNHECVVCGKSNTQEKEDSGRALSVHHIQKAKMFVQDDGTLNEEKAHRLENLITLCGTCHRRWEGIPLKPEGI